MEYKNNMFKLPVYIPNYNISNNQETEKKTDKKYKYTYVNIDSSYRQTEDVYEYSQYYYLDNNPFVLNENKTEIKLKLKQEYTNDFKNYDKITIEHIQPIIIADFFNNLITIQNHKAIFNDLPEQLKFTNSDYNYLCTIQFNLFLGEKLTTQRIKGGNTDEFYINDEGGTVPKTQMLYDMHPDVTDIVYKFGRIHHQVNYEGFDQKLNRIDKGW